MSIYKTKLANLHMQMAAQVRVIEQEKEAEIESIQRKHEAESRDQREKLATVQLNLCQTHNYMMELIKDYQRLKEICRKLPEWGRITVQELGSQVEFWMMIMMMMMMIECSLIIAWIECHVTGHNSVMFDC